MNERIWHICGKCKEPCAVERHRSEIDSRLVFQRSQCCQATVHTVASSRTPKATGE